MKHIIPPASPDRYDAVIAPSGQVGMLFRIVGDYGIVQFGADGPFRRYLLENLRCASVAEIRNAGLYGVGFNIRG